MAGAFFSMRRMHQLADDAAVGYPSARTAPGAQAGELALKRLELATLRTDPLELRVDEAVHFLARGTALS